MNQQAVLSTANAEPVPHRVHSETNQRPEPVSRAVIKSELTVNTLQGQNVMKRSFPAVSRSFFQVSVILRIIHRGDDEKIQKLSAFLSQQFDEVELEMSKEVERIKKILDDNCVEVLAEFTHPVRLNVEVDSPHSARFLKLVSKMDTLIQLIETGWLTNEFNDDQRKHATFKWQQRLNKFASRIIATESALRKSAAKSGKAEEVAAAAPEEPELLDDELAAQVRDEQHSTEKELKQAV